MMATLRGYLITLIARGPLSLQGTRGDPGAAPGWAAEAGAAGHVVAPELPRAGQWELEPQGTWRPRSYLGLAAGAGAAGHVAAPELPRAGQWEPEPQDTWRRRSPPQQGGEARSYSLRGGAWIHVLLFILT
jgi:hypothetical protein